MTVEEFNKQYPVGSLVNYHPIIGRPGCLRVQVRSRAWNLPNGDPVIQVEGRPGCVALDAISISSGENDERTQ